MSRSDFIGHEATAVMLGLKTPEPLLYNGRPMKLEPVAPALSLQMTAETLQKVGKAVLTRLEPGDGTRYDVLLTPCWTDGVATTLWGQGINPSDAGKYIHAIWLGRMQGHGCLVRVDHAVGEWDLEAFCTNPWTRTFMAWWLTQLGAAMREAA